MARRFDLVALAAAILAACPAGASAATAPASAPQITTERYASPVGLRWTPAPDVLTVSQAVYGSPGACSAPAAGGQAVVGGLGSSATTASVDPAADGTSCYFIRVTDLLGASADGPGVTVVVDRTNPTATVAIAGTAPGGVVAGTVAIVGSAADGVSGVASSFLVVGGVGACAGGAIVGPAWNTTGYPDGTYDVCNVVTDHAGHGAVSAVTVTVANAVTPIAAALPARPRSDTVAPPAPRRLAIVLPRSRAGAGPARVTLRWANPRSPDLDRVVVVLNRKRAPRSAADGRVLYRGLGTSLTLDWRAVARARLALYAYDHSGNVSRPARRLLALTSLVPRSGSVLDAAPRLSWKARSGAAYYNVQVFRNGTRVFVGWPSRPSYRLPPGRLAPGTYVWFVWPALRRAGRTPVFGRPLGRATFVYAP